MIVIKKIYFLFMSYMYIPMVVPNHSRVSRRHQLLSLNPLSLSNSRSSATAQKPVNFISHICGLGASVGCERVERTFNAPRVTFFNNLIALGHTDCFLIFKYALCYQIYIFQEEYYERRIK